MRAFVIKEFGAAGSVEKLPDPEPEAGQVRVRVAAAALNPADNGVIKGFMKDYMEHRFPLIPGLDMAGTVDEVGAGVGPWKVGDEVFGGLGKMFMGQGTLAELTTASAGAIARRPQDMDAEFGGAVPLAGVSALMCVEPMTLRHGDVVVIVGAAGGIGSFAVQLAKAAGAHVVGVTRAVNDDYLRGLGADETIDYSTEDVVDSVRRAHPDGVAGVIHLGGDKGLVAGLAELVRDGGHVASMRGGADVEGLAKRGVNGINVMTMVTTAALEKLAGHVTAGTIRRPEIKNFPLERAGDAFKEIAGGHARGKLVVIP